MHDATSQLNDVMKENSQKTKTYIIHTYSGGVSATYDADTDTTGMNADMEEALRRGRNRP